MTVPDTSGRAFLSDWATRRGLRWAGGYEDLPLFIGSREYEELEVKQHVAVTQHVASFKRRGRKPSGEPMILALLSFPYVEDSDQLREATAAFATRYSLDHRVNHPEDRVYNVERYTPIAFWRESFFSLD